MNTPILAPSIEEQRLIFRLAARGLRLFPVKPRNKQPLISNWQHEATCDEERIRDWLKEFPECNWAVATGPESGVFVLDIDGEQGLAALHDFEKQGYEIPPTLVSSTGRGSHVWFKWPGNATAIRNSAGKIAPGLDVRGAGGYVVIPPSIHSNGAQYRFTDEESEIAAAPQWLLDKITQPAAGSAPLGGTLAKSDATIPEGQRNQELASLGGAMRHKGMTPAAIEAALLAENKQRCVPPLGDREVRAIAESVSRYEPAAPGATPGADDSWPDPEPLGCELPPVPAFDLQLLPVSLRPLVEDTAERMQVPLDYPAIVGVNCLAGATNRRAAIQPKAVDSSWVVVPNLWGGIIAPPGFMKSPVISAITHPLTKVEALWRVEYESATGDHQQQQEEAELRQAAWREQFKAAQKSGKDAPVRPDDSLAAPTRRRIVTQDATFESLHTILSENPAGIMVIRDELTGWLAQLDSPGREGERAFYLSAWNGDTGHTIDRIGRGSIHVPACCVSILGGIQPARLRAYLTDALRDGPANDGLIQRFQLLVFPDPPRDWHYLDRRPNSAAISNAHDAYSRLAHMDGAEPLRMKFLSDAQELFIAWLTELEAKCRGIELHPALVSHLAKYRSLMPSLALLFELADGETETVSLQHAQQAAAFCDYLESHARRIYSMVISPDVQSASELSRHLAAGWKREEEMFTARDVYRNAWRGLSTPEAVRQALGILTDAGWLRPSELKEGKGRPTELYLMNPKIVRRSK